MIDLLIPVLGRPQNAQPLVDSIHANTTVPHTIIFLCTHGDQAQIEACKQTGAIVHLVDPGPAEYARKINLGALLDYTNHPWVFTGADDLTFGAAWDTAALHAARDTGKMVVGTNDNSNPKVKAGKHATHSLVHRDYLKLGTIDEPGKLIHEGYHHQYVDNELVETAMFRGQFVFAANAIVKHNHPIYGGAPMDATYKKALDPTNAKADRRLYQSRRRLWR